MRGDGQGLAAPHAHARRRLPGADGHAHPTGRGHRRRCRGGHPVSAITMTTTIQPSSIRPRRAGFLRDVITIAGRALRALPREVESIVPPVFIALFFFVVNIATLQRLTEG